MDPAGNERPAPGIRGRGGDQKLIVRLDRDRRGDERALRDVIREFSPLVHGVALSVTGSEADAADVLQEVFIGLPEALHRFDGRNFAGWLSVVTRRRALMLIRSEKRRAKYAFLAGNSVGRGAEDQTLNRIAIERALARLPATLKSVFLMKEVQGLSHSEISGALGITESLSQVRLHRARRALRRLLA